MSGGQNTKPSPINGNGSIGIDKDASLVSTETAHRAVLGYTIIEVMIFLAISGVMFLIAATFINGKQAQVTFKNDVSALQSTIRTTINDVENGTYPSRDNIDCTPGTNAQPAISNGSNGQGTNLGCIFLGKTMNFDQAGAQYSIASLAGNQNDVTGVPVTTIAQAFPVALDGLTTTDSLGSLTLKLMCTYPANPAESYGFGIIGSLNSAVSTSTSGATISAGLYGYPSALSSGQTPSAAQLDGMTPLTKVVIYVTDDRHSAYLTVGDNNGLDVTITYTNTIPGSCS